MRQFQLRNEMSHLRLRAAHTCLPTRSAHLHCNKRSEAQVSGMMWRAVPGSVASANEAISSQKQMTEQEMTYEPL
jgi:hypothetical protein